MNKVEATKTLADFIEFNKQDISNMTVDYPELGGIFGDLLVAIDKEYASGTINKADLVVAETKAFREPQEGDFYRSGNGDVFQLIQPLPNEWRILDLDTGNDKSVDINDVRYRIADGIWELAEDKSNRAVFGFVVGESIEVIDEGRQYPSYTKLINAGSNIYTVTVDDVKNGEVGKVLGKAASTIFDDSQRVVEIKIDNTANRYYIRYDGIRSLGMSALNTTTSQTYDKNAQDLVGYTLVDKQNKFQFLEVKKGKRFAYSAKLINLTTKNTFNWSLGQATVNKLLSGGTTVSKQYIEELQGGANLPRKAAPTPPSIAKGMPDYNNMNNLVGLTLLFTVSGKQYKVNKLIKNNPKNIIYEIQNLANNIITDHPIPRNTVQRLLRAEDNMNIKVVELQAIKAAAQTTTSVVPTQTNATNTYLSDWRFSWKADGKRASPQRSTKTKGELGMGYDGIVYERIPNVSGVYQWKKTKTNAFHDDTLSVFKKEDLQVLSDQLTYALTLFSKGDSEYDETQRQITRVAKELSMRF